jgi:hypothetical protein
MTRKHFIALALSLNSIRPSRTLQPIRCREDVDEQRAEYDRWWEAVCTVADVCEESNERFNRGKFIRVAENGA